MTTKTDDRLDAMRQRIDGLEARAQAGGARAKESMQGQVAALRRQEASARAAAREAHDARTRELTGHAEAAEAKLEQLDAAADAEREHLGASLKRAEHALSAELADDRRAFTDAMDAYLQDFKDLANELSEKLRGMSATARGQAGAAISDMRQSRDAVAERLAQVRTASGERWRESKESIAAARAELERKADEAIEKLK